MCVYCTWAGLSGTMCIQCDSVIEWIIIWTQCLTLLEFCLSYMKSTKTEDRPSCTQVEVPVTLLRIEFRKNYQYTELMHNVKLYVCYTLILWQSNSHQIWTNTGDIKWCNTFYLILSSHRFIKLSSAYVK